MSLQTRKPSKTSSQRRQRRAVLSEEEYTSTLEGIVQRDYFPELPLLQRQAAVLEKRAVGDIAGAVAVRRAARQLQSHEEALADQEEEDEHDITESKLRKMPRPLHRETVSGFHARVTSEDNCEFDQTQRKEVQANRERLQEVFQKSNPALRITDGASTVGSETPLLASDKFNAPLHRIEASQWKDSSQDRNSLFFTPNRDSVVPLEEQQTKPLLTSGCHKDDAAALMPPPASVQTKRNASATESSLVVAGQELSVLLPKQYLVEYVPKHATEKSIEPSQTRFSSSLASTALLTPRKRYLEGDESSTTEYSTDGTAATTDLDEPSSLTLAQERKARAKRQRNDREALVAMTPLLVPGKSGGNNAAINASPLITWGTVASTPLVLGGMDTANEKSFSFPEESHREEAARRAEAELEQAKHQRKLKRKKHETPVDSRIASLTPAARSLLEKSSAPVSSGVRSRGAFASALRSSYTPRVNRSGEKSRSIKRDHALKATPRTSRRQLSDDAVPSLQKDGVPQGNITDGLLKLPGK